MTIDKVINDNLAEISLTGWLDTKTAPVFAAEMDELPAEVTEIRFNMAELEYISSAGIRQIVSAYKKMNGKIELLNVSDDVKDLFRMTGLDKKITIK